MLTIYDMMSGPEHFLQDCMCAQRRQTIAQSDQSLRPPPEDALDLWLPMERPAKTQIRLRGCAV